MRFTLREQVRSNSRIVAVQTSCIYPAFIRLYSYTCSTLGIPLEFHHPTHFVQIWAIIAQPKQYILKSRAQIWYGIGTWSASRAQ